ncbi:hypothetical protein [uncultured Shewanella sp.]|uniref:hypothetical protein n=1 Tax=uncultured Shewanella sp. TaxID=173975 RepID=UPI0026376657|nr:hypothetical protein [uncultured Shewanella sp.]
MIKITIPSLFRLAPLCVITSLMLGCGSDHKNDKNNPQDESHPSATQDHANVIIPQDLKSGDQFTLTLLKKDTKGKTQPDVKTRVLVHDTKGNLVGDFQANDKGEITVDWQDNSQHLSVVDFHDVYNNHTQETTQIANISSLIDFSQFDSLSSTMITEQANVQSSDDNDEIDIDFTQLQGSSPHSTVKIDSLSTRMSINASAMDKLTLIYDTENSEHLVQLISNDGQQARGGLLNFRNKSSISLNKDHFTSDGVSATIGDLSGWDEHAFIISQHTTGSLSAQLAQANDNVFIYPELARQSWLHTDKTTTKKLSTNHWMTAINFSQLNFDAQGQLSNTPEQLLTVGTHHIQAIEAMSAQLMSNDNTTALDLSAFQSNAQTSNIVLCDTQCDEQHFSWTLTSTEATSLPALTLPDDLQATFANIAVFDIEISLNEQINQNKVNIDLSDLDDEDDIIDMKGFEVSFLVQK